MTNIIQLFKKLTNIKEKNKTKSTGEENLQRLNDDFKKVTQTPNTYKLILNLFYENQGRLNEIEIAAIPKKNIDSIPETDYSLEECNSLAPNIAYTLNAGYYRLKKLNVSHNSKTILNKQEISLCSIYSEFLNKNKKGCACSFQIFAFILSEYQRTVKQQLFKFYCDTYNINLYDTTKELLAKLHSKINVELLKEIVALRQYCNSNSQTYSDAYEETALYIEKEFSQLKNPKAKPNREQMEFARKKSAINSINFLLTEYKHLKKNERLNRIVDTFLQENVLENIELLAIPSKITNAGFVKPKYIVSDLEDSEDVEQVKYTLMSAFYQWKQDKYCMAKTSKTNAGKKTKYLFDSLQEQKIISESYTAFCCYISEKQRLLLIKNYLSLCSKYGLTETASSESIIEYLNEKKIFENNIKEFIALKFYKENQFKTYSSCIELANKLVSSQLKKLQSRNYIMRLENGEKITKISLQEIDLMSGLEFEKFIAKYFTDLGYDTKITKASGDQGIDILVKRDDYTVAIQAKCYNGIVGNHAIMEAVAGTKYYNANKCMVITNSHFTKSAIELAKANNVELWDRSVLQEKLNSL